MSKIRYESKEEKIDKREVTLQIGDLRIKVIGGGRGGRISEDKEHIRGEGGGGEEVKDSKKEKTLIRTVTIRKLVSGQ